MMATVPPLDNLKQRLSLLLLEGLESGYPVVADKAYWDMKKEKLARHPVASEARPQEPLPQWHRGSCAFTQDDEFNY